MTDLDKIKACARAMEHDVQGAFSSEDELGNETFHFLDIGPEEVIEYNPLHNSAQADALEGWMLERGIIKLDPVTFSFWRLDSLLDETLGESDPAFEYIADMTVAENRRRARVECVAKMTEGV